MKKKKQYKKKKTKEVAKEETISLYGEAISYARDSFRNGISELEISRVLATNKLLRPENITFILNKASSEIASQYVRDRNSIVSLHVQRYDKDIKKGMNDKFTNVHEPYVQRKLRIACLEDVLFVMQSKERVLQLHNKETQVKVFNKVNAKIRERKIIWDLSSLSLDEKIEFLSLVTKAKKSTTELHSIILRPKLEEVKTEDAVFTVVDSTVNIDSIKKENEKPKEVKIHPIDKQKQLALSPIDVMQRLQNAFKKTATEQFKNITPQRNEDEQREP